MISTKGVPIITAVTEADFNAAQKLFIAYQQYLEVDLCFQGFDAELLQLPIMYGPPSGALLLAKQNDEYIGCVALRDKGNGHCEMKRLYVTDAYLNKGIGRLLAKSIINKARELHYQKMILDTLSRLQPAIQLYTSLGFTATNAYYPNPLSGVVYLELRLA